MRQMTSRRSMMRSFQRSTWKGRRYQVKLQNQQQLQKLKTNPKMRQNRRRKRNLRLNVSVYIRTIQTVRRKLRNRRDRMQQTKSPRKRPKTNASTMKSSIVMMMMRMQMASGGELQPQKRRLHRRSGAASRIGEHSIACGLFAIFELDVELCRQCGVVPIARESL